MSIIKQYLAALLSLAITVLTALVAIPHIDLTSGIQLAILGVSTLTTLWLPLLKNAKWQAALKTLSVLVLAALSGLTPLITGGTYDHLTIGLFVLNILSALAPEIGVQIRKADLSLAA
jgi:hypothetical protein